MIRESFLKAIDSIEQARTFNPNKVDQLISLCKRVSVNHSQTDLLKMYRLCSNIVLSLPDYEFPIYKNIVYDFSNALIELGKKHKRVSRYYDGFTFDQSKFQFKKFMQFADPHIFAMGLFLNLSNHLERLGLPGEAYNALLKSMDPWVKIYNKDTREGDINLENFDLFESILIGNVAVGIDGNRRNLIERTSVKFRLLKILGNIDDNANAIFKAYRGFTKIGRDAIYADILFYTNYFELLSAEHTVKEKFDEVKNILIEQFSLEISKGDADTSFIIASSLAKVLNSKEWGEKAINCQPSPVYWAELLQIETLVSCLSEPFNDSLTMDLINRFLIQASSIHSDRMMFELCKQKYSDIINLAAVTFISKEKYQLAVELIYSWNVYKQSNSMLPSPKGRNLLVFIANFNQGGGLFLLYNKDEVIIMGTGSDKRLSDVIKLKDKIEASWTAILDETDTLIPNMGTRNHVELSLDYIETLSDFIGLKELLNLLSEFPQGTKFEYIELSWTNTPVVPILTNSAEHTCTISITNSELSLPNEIKKVLIWANPDGFLHMANFEIEALTHILSENDIEWELYQGSECTKQLFIHKYSDPTFDLIWIISHGEFNSDNPPFSLLHVSATEPITSWELQKLIPFCNRRRYVILNACQSGSAAVRYNSMGFLGIGPSITNEYQTVLGHLWFVDSLASAILGSLTLHSLLEGNLLQNALKSASKTMTRGNQTIADKLSEIGDSLQLIDRVRNASSKDLSLPYYSMSAVLFE
ncbi:CHAT domain-containing protein [Metabacillus herbersteinensis]|uniref:CHAT domain-containing protein n=1 Tax=Metabacillus herbersteinensis TaxID=283816 RepID=A0ABV6GDW3_9BACI